MVRKNETETIHSNTSSGLPVVNKNYIAMAKNYRFEILSLLAAQEGKIVDIHPFIRRMIGEENHSAGYIVIMLHAMRLNGFVWFDETDLPKNRICNKYILGDKPIPARIEPQGIDEFRALQLKFAGNLHIRP